ncbi:1408_t:CDS:10 [Ambispora gerdemannii]|uniref:Polynucleotide 5'-hydroxyl-kinase GRC3 n=1 Tax=Ambispora gerdemannii TaxID=144530 RepID=A0A9N8ZW00_9GLOM|nr:1408_t:CDS:10 [Ambispora gerdemannii]
MKSAVKAQTKSGKKEEKENESPKEWKLEPEHEFRFEVDFGTTVKLKLIEGTAEIFGTEIGIGPEYEFSGRKVAVFTWHGKSSVEYLANETPMVSYLNMHLALEQCREAARERGGPGPRVMIVGPEDVGKTSLTKILLSYALRQGRQPIFVDLDTNEASLHYQPSFRNLYVNKIDDDDDTPTFNQGTVTIPGALTATPINQILDVEEGFGSSATTLPSIGSSTTPIVYYYGYAEPGENVKLYKILTARLANTVNLRLDQDEDARTSGLIIDTSGLIDNNVGYEILQHCIQVFSANIIIVLGHERLYSDMARLYKDQSDIKVLKLSKSGGVVNRDKMFRRQSQMRKIQEYFYGTSKVGLQPFNASIDFHSLSIYRVGFGSLAPSSALPIGIDRKVSETQLVRVEPDETLRHSILALITTDSPEEPALLEANVSGFLYVSEIDNVKHKMTILSPCPGRLPKPYALIGGFKWMEA